MPPYHNRAIRSRGDAVRRKWKRSPRGEERIGGQELFRVLCTRNRPLALVRKTCA